MACFGGGSTISKDKANAYQEQEVKLRKLHIWFATSINRKDLSPSKLTGIPSQVMQERIIYHESHREVQQERGETAAKISKLQLEDTEAKLCNAISTLGEQEFYAFLTGHGFLNQNATNLAHWYQNHKEIDKQRNAKQKEEERKTKRESQNKELTNVIANLSDEKFDKLINAIKEL